MCQPHRERFHKLRWISLCSYSGTCFRQCHHVPDDTALWLVLFWVEYNFETSCPAFECVVWLLQAKYWMLLDSFSVGSKKRFQVHPCHNNIYRTGDFNDLGRMIRFAALINWNLSAACTRSCSFAMMKLCNPKNIQRRAIRFRRNMMFACLSDL